MTTIHADELQTGDVVEYLGTPHRVAHVDRHAGLGLAGRLRRPRLGDGARPPGRAGRRPRRLKALRPPAGSGV